MRLYRVILGDWSRDGHNQTEEFIVRCNKTPKEIAEGLKLLRERLGFHLEDRLCKDYEDRYIHSNVLDSILSICPNDSKRNYLLSVLEPVTFYNAESNPFANWTEGELTLEIYNSLPKEVCTATSKFSMQLRFGITLDSYLDFVMICLSIVIPDLTWEVQNEEEIPTLFKGFGYGLFY